MKLSFSTLGCPAWSYQDILRRAAEYGFDGITIRGLNGELDLVKVAEFQPTRRAETRRQAERAVSPSTWWAHRPS
jgi:sugar phosphate isomerase/epimerase